MWDVIIIGAGASGLMCAIEAGKRGRKILVLDHAKCAGKKIIMSGGGRCNFTNLYIETNNYLCDDLHFVTSILNRYTPWDFIAMVDKHNIKWHERDQGQLFCDDSAKQITKMLLAEAKAASVNIELTRTIFSHSRISDKHFSINTSMGQLETQALVIATGGLSLPKLGATPFAYKVAEQYNLPLTATRAGLVPLTLHQMQKEKLTELSGISLLAVASCNSRCANKTKLVSFTDKLLFTHRGLSGPVILQISNYWKAGTSLYLDLLPNLDLYNVLLETLQKRPELGLKKLLSFYLPKRVVACILEIGKIKSGAIKQYNEKQLKEIASLFHGWKPEINGTEGYRTAEVTLGGINTDAICSKTMQVKSVKGLYFIGEALDVTGWLGGFNFQWAWASGWAAGQIV
ncbi:MAG: NAD(P)/FAD-dependent oxidoreductase [Psychromonas sp.]|nr:NAD(P)/FAD-dependent oxidoreductase [Psychromonas sp.]